MTLPEDILRKTIQSIQETTRNLKVCKAIIPCLKIGNKRVVSLFDFNVLSIIENFPWEFHVMAEEPNHLAYALIKVSYGLGVSTSIKIGMRMNNDQNQTCATTIIRKDEWDKNRSMKILNDKYIIKDSVKRWNKELDSYIDPSGTSGSLEDFINLLFYLGDLYCIYFRFVAPDIRPGDIILSTILENSIPSRRTVVLAKIQLTTGVYTLYSSLKWSLSLDELYEHAIVIEDTGGSAKTSHLLSYRKGALIEVSSELQTKKEVKVEDFMIIDMTFTHSASVTIPIQDISFFAKRITTQ